MLTQANTKKETEMQHKAWEANLPQNSWTECANFS